MKGNEKRLKKSGSSGKIQHVETSSVFYSIVGSITRRKCLSAEWLVALLQDTAFFKGDLLWCNVYIQDWSLQNLTGMHCSPLSQNPLSQCKDQEWNTFNHIWLVTGHCLCVPQTGMGPACWSNASWARAEDQNRLRESWHERHLAGNLNIGKVNFITLASAGRGMVWRKSYVWHFLKALWVTTAFC